MKFFKRFKKLPLRHLLKLLSVNQLILLQVFFFILDKLVKREDNDLTDQVIDQMRESLGHHDIEDLK